MLWLLEEDVLIFSDYLFKWGNNISDFYILVLVGFLVVGLVYVIVVVGILGFNVWRCLDDKIIFVEIFE